MRLLAKWAMASAAEANVAALELLVVLRCPTLLSDLLGLWVAAPPNLDFPWSSTTVPLAVATASASLMALSRCAANEAMASAAE